MANLPDALSTRHFFELLFFQVLFSTRQKVWASVNITAGLLQPVECVEQQKSKQTFARNLITSHFRLDVSWSELEWKTNAPSICTETHSTDTRFSGQSVEIWWGIDFEVQNFEPRTNSKPLCVFPAKKFQYQSTKVLAWPERFVFDHTICDQTMKI